MLSLIACIGVTFIIGFWSTWYWHGRYHDAQKSVAAQEQVIADLRKLKANADEIRRACQESEKAAWESVKQLESELAVKHVRIEYLLDHLRQIRALADGVKHLDPAETKP